MIWKVICGGMLVVFIASCAVYPAPSGRTSISEISFRVGSVTMAMPWSRSGRLSEWMKADPAAEV